MRSKINIVNENINDVRKITRTEQKKNTDEENYGVSSISVTY